MTKIPTKRLIWPALWRGRSSSYDTQFLRTAAGTLLCIATALIVGKLVGDANWPYLAVVAALPLAAFWPAETALGMFGVVVPFDAIAIAGGADSGVSLTRLVGAAATALLLFIGLSGGRLRTPPRAALWWSLFVLWCGITSLWALDPDAALSRMPTALALLLLYLVSVSFQFTPTERRRVVVLTILGGCCAAAYVIAEFYQGVSIAGSDRASLVVGGQEADPNGMAAGLLLPISLAMALFFSSQKRGPRVLAMLAVGGIGLSIFLTMSRGAVLALIVIAVVFLLRLKKMRVLAPVIALSLLLLLVPANFFSRIEKAGDSGGAGRIPIWTAGVEALKHFWVQGAGVDNFPAAYTLYAGSAPKFNGFARASHNIYLGTAVELGIVGVILLLLAIRAQLRAVRHASGGFDPMLVASEAACWAVLVAGFFLDTLWRKYFWLSWILLTLYTHRRNDTQPRADL